MKRGLRNEKLKIYLTDFSVSTGPGLLHDLVVIGACPLAGADPSVTSYAIVLHRWQTWCSGLEHKHNQGQWGCTICRVCRSSLVHSKLPLLGWLSILSVLRLSGGSRCLQSVASTVCCSGHGHLLPGVVYPCWPVGHCLACLLPRSCLEHLLSYGRCSSCQRCRNHHGNGLLSDLYFPEQISLGAGAVCH